MPAAVSRLTPPARVPTGAPAGDAANGPLAGEAANGPVAADGPPAAEAEPPNPAAVRALPSLLANMLIARVDFLLRFVVGMLYGAKLIRSQSVSPWSGCVHPQIGNRHALIQLVVALASITHLSCRSRSAQLGFGDIEAQKCGAAQPQQMPYRPCLSVVSFLAAAVSNASHA